MKYLFLLTIILFSCNENNNNSNSTDINMKEQYLFVGTYTKKEGHVDGKGEGIYRFDYLMVNDLVVVEHDSLPTPSFSAINPSFLTISKNKKFLYAVNELNPNDGDSGTVTSYKINAKTKGLELINQQKTNSFAPCHVTVDATNHLAFVANYVGGVVCVYPILNTGGLGEASQIIKLEGKGVTDRQEGSHPHSTTISPDNKFLFIADLGTDKISSYQIDFENKKLLPTQQGHVKVEDGAGPRHFTFHPNEKLAYVVNELNSTVNAFEYDASEGTLKQIQSISTLPQGFSDMSYCADIHVHPSGKFLYASNRGHNSIAVYHVDEKTGMLIFQNTTSTKGDFPRNFVIDETGDFLWVANQNSNSIYLFKINTETGELNETMDFEVPTPVCLKFL